MKLLKLWLTFTLIATGVTALIILAIAIIYFIASWAQSNSTWYYLLLLPILTLFLAVMEYLSNDD